MSDSGLRPGDRVTLHYRLEASGRLIVDTFADAPETFSLGAGEIDPRLELLLLGLATGDHRHFELDAADAFGLRDEDLLQPVPLSEFADPADLQAGDGVQFNLPNGQSLNGLLVEIGAETVLVDFNHPLAGQPIHFEVRILAIEPL
jgi:FKBP-type peptidyl-prolyl cis-trans isomerase SlpA